MKTIKLFTLLLLFAFSGFSQGEFSYVPAKPKPGDSITVTYTPSTNVPVKIYGSEFQGLAVNDLDTKTKRTSGKYITTFKTDTSATFVFFAITAGGALDNNKGDGYTIELYENGKPRKQANIAKSYFYQYYGEDAGITSDKERGLAAMKKELEYYPEDDFVRLNVLRAEFSNNKETGTALIEKEIEAKKTNLKTENDYNTLAQYYNILKKADEAKKVGEDKKVAFPEGSWVVQEEITAFSQEKDMTKKKARLAEIEKKLDSDPKWSRYKSSRINYRATILNEYMRAKDWSTLKNAFKEYGFTPELAATEANKGLLYNIYNSTAWRMYEDSAELDFAEDLARQATAYQRAALEDGIAKGKNEKAIKNLKAGYSMYADTYAAVLLKSGKFEEGYKIAKEYALDYSEGNNADYNAIYAQLAEKVLKPAELKPLLEKFVMAGKSNDIIKNQLKKYHGEQEFDSYFATLETAAKRKMREELEKKLENKPAPTFALLNLDGTKVNLAELKGKTVVVDFWATWCGPCIASFPGMKKAQEKYKDDPTVKFVFVNSWESAKDIKKEVAEFIQKGAYPFDVVFDLDNKVIESYGVNGIPTKFIVDPKGNIRFTSIGYSGSPDKLVDEISAMIDLARSK
jgi:thiol-disulfide isomerase/thioredoxin